MTTPRRAALLRADIQALRAIAVLAVLLYHLWPNRLTGGYVGVDVFFVISGFLITSHLLRELEATGGIRLGRFWARRAARLLPSSLLVLALTALAVIAFVPRGFWNQFLGETLAASLYIENWRLAADSVDYLAGENQPSPIQHFWTLSVEEQFYVALPLLLIGGALVLRRMPARRATLIVLVSAASASFAYGVWLTAWSPSGSYFSTLTRAWEFGLGALVAFLPPAWSLAKRIIVPLGVAAIVLSSLMFTEHTPFPGIAAAVPVLGTALVIYGGQRSLLSRAGTLAPVAFLGRVSYAVYLAHWPPIVLVPFITGHPLTTWEKLAILAGSLAVGWWLTTFIEDPVRFSPRLLGGRRPGTVAVWSALGMAIVVMIGGSALLVNAHDSRENLARAEALANAVPYCFGAQAIDPAIAPCQNADLDGIVVPAPADAQSDDDNRAECWSRTTDPELNVCSVGAEADYDRHLFAVGDSHNNTLVGVYDDIGRQFNWRIDIAGHAGCYWTDTPQKLSDAESTTACASWVAEVDRHIDQSDVLDAIVVTRSSGGRTADEQTIDGMVAAWTGRPDVDVPVIAILDNPRLPKDVVACLERDLDTATARCAVTRSEAVFDDGQAQAAARTQNAHHIDLTNRYCTAETCAPIVGGVLVYRDGNHLTATYASTIAPYLATELERVLSRY